MKTLSSMGLLFFPGIRALLYLQFLIENQWLPSVVVIQGENHLPQLLKKYPSSFWEQFRFYFDYQKDMDFYRREYGFETLQVSEKDINSQELNSILCRRSEDHFIFSGGGIIRQELFRTGKTFIHTHPAILPSRRGSTCFYYDMLEGKACAATSFEMRPELDEGDILAHKEFQVPRISAEWSDFYDLIFDPWMRAQVLALTLRNYVQTGSFSGRPQHPEDGHMHYIIHPILKNLAISKFLAD